MQIEIEPRKTEPDQRTMGERLLKIVREGKGPGVTKEAWFEQLDTIVGSGEVINYQDQDSWGYTALMVAVMDGDIDTVTYLVNKRADVNQRGKDCGWTALMISVINSSFSGQSSIKFPSC